MCINLPLLPLSATAPKRQGSHWTHIYHEITYIHHFIYGNMNAYNRLQLLLYIWSFHIILRCICNVEHLKCYNLSPCDSLFALPWQQVHLYITLLTLKLSKRLKTHVLIATALCMLHNIINFGYNILKSMYINLYITLPNIILIMSKWNCVVLQEIIKWMH